MLGNCHHQQQQRQQIVSILSTSSGQQQNFPSINGDGDYKEFNNLQMSNHINNNTNMIMPAATATTIARAINMDQKPNHIQDQPPVRCPRCDSTNTKFCYYNNYSLSQPRHFCKACKRYWTRGGTLRNVPVGGGCRRKNKRINNNNNKRIFSSSSSNTSSLADVGTTINPTFGGGDGGLTSHNNSTLLYGLPTNYLPYIGAANFPFSSNYDYDMNPSSYGFSTTNPKQIIHDLISSNPPNSSIISTFGSNTHPSSNMSLYPDTLLQQQHKFNFQPIFPNHTTTTTHHDEGLGVLQYPKEDDDNNVDRDGQYDDTHDTVKNMIDHSGYHHHHEYANLMDANHHHQQQHDQSESVVVAVTSSPHTSISWNNDDNSARTSGTTRISDGDGGGAHHLLDSTNNNNCLNPTYSAAAIGSSSSSIPS